MSEQKHTPGELALRRFEPRCVHIGQAGNLDTVHDGQIVVHAFGDFEDDLELAQRIVRAANCHDDLLDALKNVTAALIVLQGDEWETVKAAGRAIEKAERATQSTVGGE